VPPITPRIPALYPSRMGWGVSAEFLAHPTPCILAGERVGPLHTCVSGLHSTMGVWGGSHCFQMCTHPAEPPGGTDAASALIPAGLFPSSEATAASGQGQAEKGKGTLQLKGRCHPPRGFLLPPASERGSAERPCVLCLPACISLAWGMVPS